MAMLEVKDLHVHYGVIEAIKGISFEVEQGEVIALIGANGAGKTTTLHTVTGLIKPPAAALSLRERISRRRRDIRLCQWGWRMCRKGAVCLRSFRFMII